MDSLSGYTATRTFEKVSDYYLMTVNFTDTNNPKNVIPQYQTPVRNVDELYLRKLIRDQLSGYISSQKPLSIEKPADGLFSLDYTPNDLEQINLDLERESFLETYGTVLRIKRACEAGIDLSSELSSEELSLQSKWKSDYISLM